MGFFDKLKQGLGKTRESFNEKINSQTDDQNTNE